MIPKSGNRFSDRIMLKPRDWRREGRTPMCHDMSGPLIKFLAVAIAGIVAVAAADGALARAKKPRVKPKPAPTVLHDYDGTPIIMQGLERPTKQRAPGEIEPSKRTERPRKVPRGSGGYIPPPVPSPSGGSPPAVLLQPAPQPYRPPPIKSFGDRVTDCIHSYPLNKGIGNNPIDQQMYIRQCAQ
jgi:hypothetical protein